MASGQRVRTRRLAVGVVCLAALCGLASVDAARRRAEHDEGADVRRAATRLTGLPDLALSSSARWIRHPSLAEPGAAFADGPASFDGDPGGGIIAAPDTQRSGRPLVVRVRPPR